MSDDLVELPNTQTGKAVGFLQRQSAINANQKWEDKLVILKKFLEGLKKQG